MPASIGCPVFPLHTPNPLTRACSSPRAKVCGRDTGKHPRTRSGLRDATTDPNVIRQFWARWPDANVGAMPPPGHVWLDEDRGEGHGDVDGLAAMLALELEHGEIGGTPTSRSGSGGSIACAARSMIPSSSSALA